MERKITFFADERHAGRMIKEVLKGEFAFSHKLITRMKQRENGVMVNGAHVFVTYRLKAGDSVALVVEEEGAASENIVPVRGDLIVLFEDTDILVVDKPAGVPVHPSQDHYTDSLANYVAYYYAQKGRSTIFRPINRLDRNTSGIVLIAKNQYCAHLLHAKTKNREIKKEYMAIVYGTAPERGEICAPIGRCEGSTIERRVMEGGKEAVTQYKRVDHTKEASLLRVTTLTGRTHQIRVHLSYIGHPLIGDFLYGKEEPEKIIRHALHMGSLTFSHPLTGEEMHFHSPLAADMQKLWEMERREA